MTRAEIGHVRNPWSIFEPGIGADAGHAGRLLGFRPGLKDAGFIEGEELAIDYRWAEGQFDGLPEAPPFDG